MWGSYLTIPRLHSHLHILAIGPSRLVSNELAGTVYKLHHQTVWMERLIKLMLMELRENASLSGILRAELTKSSTAASKQLV